MTITRQPGVSFVIRARNEARLLFDNLVSLRGVTIPHEIVLVLHRCTDESKKVAETCQKQGMPIRIIEDWTPVSRAGYETFVTPARHPNSLPEFYNRAFGHARYRWLVKWDADFTATEFFLELLNNYLNIDETKPLAYQLPCALGEDVLSIEEYMFNSYNGYGKYYFWENRFPDENESSVFVHTTCINSVPPATIKNYWKEPPWFLDENTRDDILAEKYETMIHIVGPEPRAFARSNNPEFDAHWKKLAEYLPELGARGIFPTR